MIPRQPSTAARRGQRILFDGLKPGYLVPTMEEIAAIPWNGLTVATTFAGCGGSSTGYRMAGYRVVWANEFVPSAQDSYRANMREGTILDPRDIKVIKASEILKAAGLRAGELDLFDGSPPCQAFSMAGQREKGWGKEREYDHGAKQKNEELFTEFARLRDGLQPRVFVAENVKGLVTGAAKGMFLEILRMLKVGYRVEARLLDAQWLGVPQQRQRLIFVGVREDLAGDLLPAFPVPLPYRYSVRDAIPWIGRATHDSGGTFKSAGDITNRPANTLTSTPKDQGHWKVDDVDIAFRGSSNGAPRGEILRSADDPANTVTAGGYGGAAQNQVEIVRRGGPLKAGRPDARTNVEEPAPAVTRRGMGSGEVRVVYANGRKGQPERDITDLPSPTITAGPPGGSAGGGPRSHFKVVETEVGFTKNATYHRKRKNQDTEDPAPTIMARRPNVEIVQSGLSISGQAIGDEYDRLNPGQQSDKYFSLVRADAAKPSPCITASGGQNAGIATVIHPTEKRKFTILELKRICSFPDDFALLGSYSAQWERLGNSVPPVMMRHIAEAIRDLVLLPARASRAKPGAKTSARPRRSRARSTTD